ncbi:MAG: glycosyltransferase family 4 protein [Thermodesulfobacteriota bacterium]
MAKLLFVSSIHINLHFRLGLMETLLRENHEVTAAAALDGGEVRLQERGIRCHSLTRIQRGGMDPRAELRCLGELYRLYRRERPEVILHYTVKPNIYGSLAAALAGIPSLSTISGAGYSFMQEGFLSRLVGGLYKLALRFPARVFFQNADDRDFFLARGLVQEDKTATVPGSGVNLDHYSPRHCSGGEKADKEAMVFLFVGRLLWDKGIGEFAAAAGRVRRSFPQTEFWVLGRMDPGNPAGVPEETFRGWIKEGTIRHLGYVQEVRPILCDSDVVVLPSYREGIPRSMLEAMAMGKPIITTDGIGCREVIEDGKNGLMVPVQDTGALAAAMVKMIDLGEERRREMGRYGRRKAVREFDEKLVIQAYMKEIKRILG